MGEVVGVIGTNSWSKLLKTVLATFINLLPLFTNLPRKTTTRPTPSNIIDILFFFNSKLPEHGDQRILKATYSHDLKTNFQLIPPKKMKYK